MKDDFLQFSHLISAKQDFRNLEFRREIFEFRQKKYFYFDWGNLEISMSFGEKSLLGIKLTFDVSCRNFLRGRGSGRHRWIRIFRRRWKCFVSLWGCNPASNQRICPSAKGILQLMEIEKGKTKISGPWTFRFYSSR